MLRVLLLTSVILLTACKEDEKKGVVSAKASISGANTRTLCSAPSGVNNDPRSMKEVLTLINAMPKPLTVPCFLDALRRPHAIQATKNTLSGQPAYSTTSPRIFLIKGLTLFISVVPSGPFMDVIEFGEVVGNGDKSVKAELFFPITKNLTETEFYETVLNSSKSGTTCGPCHGGDGAAPEGFPATAFQSPIVQPFAGQRVSLLSIQNHAELCKTQVLDECPILQSILYGGKTTEREFP